MDIYMHMDLNWVRVQVNTEDIDIEYLALPHVNFVFVSFLTLHT